MPKITSYPSVLHDDVKDILTNLRPEDAHEFGAAGIQHADAHRIVDVSTFDRTWFVDGSPVFCMGLQRIEHVALLWGFGSVHATPDVFRAITRHAWEHWIPDVFAQGVRRIEVRVPVSSTHAIRWLTRLGMTVECASLPGYSYTDEDMVQLAYTTREYRRDYVHHSSAATGHADHCDAHENVRRNSERDGARAFA